MANIEAGQPLQEAPLKPEDATAIVENAEAALQEYLERVRPFDYHHDWDEEADDAASDAERANPHITLEIRQYQRLLMASKVLANEHTESQGLKLF
ncbi:MAG TPA: hypothetical protein VJJ78_01040 [Candidatus Saccharimonadales bacterium]|nr:hypothetical protein [Candidatus Saccharimonadales bacterium]